MSEPHVGSSAIALPAHVPLAPVGRRILRIAVLLGAVAALSWALHAFGVADIEKWLDSMWRTLTDVHPA
jgi:hypothetical protein